MNSKQFKWMLAIFMSVSLLIPLNINFASATQKPLVLKVSMFTPKAVVYTKANGWILHEVERRSKGKIKFEYFYSGSLLPAKQTIAGLQTGVADIAFVATPYEPGKLPLCTVTSLPMTGKRFYNSAMAFRDLQQMPELKAELGKYNIRYLAFCNNSSYGLWSTNGIHSIAEVKGKKIRAIGGQAILMKALGAVPVSIISTEVYTALEKGTLDGSLANPIFGFDYKYNEVCRFFYALMFGNVPFLMGINKDSWEKIPSDIQKMFEDLHEPAARAAHEIYETAGEKNLQEAQAKGTVKVTEPTEKDVAFVTNLAKETVWKEWIAKMNRSGLPGEKVLDNYLKLLKKWGAQSPFKRPIYGR